MVDVSAKVDSIRQATARTSILISDDCTLQLTEDSTSEIIRTARIAGIQAAKQTAHLIPMCHQINLKSVTVDIALDRGQSAFHVLVTSKASDVTGVEMEAMVGASVAGLTIYDMVKAVDPAAVILRTEVLEKSGGKTGHWQRPESN